MHMLKGLRVWPCCQVSCEVLINIRWNLKLFKLNSNLSTTHLKNMLVKMGSSSPRDRGENSKNH